MLNDNKENHHGFYKYISQLKEEMSKSKDILFQQDFY